MNVKLLELRDRATFIPLLCIDMNDAHEYTDRGFMAEGFTERAYLLRRCGYGLDGYPTIGIAHAQGGERFRVDPYDWADRTYQVAHGYIIQHWSQLKDGDVVDVEFILGETPSKKISERLTAPV